MELSSGIRQTLQIMGTNLRLSSCPFTSHEEHWHTDNLQLILGKTSASANCPMSALSCDIIIRSSKLPTDFLSAGAGLVWRTGDLCWHEQGCWHRTVASLRLGRGKPEETDRRHLCRSTADLFLWWHTNDPLNKLSVLPGQLSERYSLKSHIGKKNPWI